MISSGFFILPGIAFSLTGPSVILAFFLASLLVVPALLSKAELATAMPRSGGVYFYLDRSMGPAAGTVVGLGAWVGLILKASFALIGFSIYFFGLLQLKVSFLPLQIFASLTCLGLMFLNIRGTKLTGRVQWWLVVVVLCALISFIAIGYRKVEFSRYSPFLTNGWQNLFAAMGLVFISYAGVTKIASVAEEVKNPAKNIPWAMGASLLVVTLVYVGGVSVVVGTLPKDQLMGNTSPISATALWAMGKWMFYVVSIAAVLAFASCANAALMSASRFPFAMARDGLLPKFFTQIGRTYTPYKAILFTSGIVVAFIFLFDVKELAKLASAFQLFLYALCSFAVIVMRESKIEEYSPCFQSPAYPYTQIFGIGGCLLLITLLGIVEILFCLGAIFFGMLWFYIYARKQVKREGAFQWLWNRVRQKKSDTLHPSLIQDLRQIQKEKGLKEGDPFKEIVCKAPVFEIETGETLENFLAQVSEYFKNTLNIEKTELIDKFLIQNKMGNTPVEAGIAIPHHRLDNLGEIHLVIGRSRHGLKVEESQDPLYAVFVILGCSNLSDLHIRILAELARRAEQENFMDLFLQAETEEEVHTLFLENLPDTEKIQILPNEGGKKIKRIVPLNSDQNSSSPFSPS
ncbi:MAG: amino acid permease [Planctomycetota bacterium]|nr:MAG: amino acid permease [Planctomycetota bacterium]